MWWKTAIFFFPLFLDWQSAMSSVCSWKSRLLAIWLVCVSQLQRTFIGSFFTRSSTFMVWKLCAIAVALIYWCTCISSIPEDYLWQRYNMLWSIFYCYMNMPNQHLRAFNTKVTTIFLQGTLDWGSEQQYPLWFLRAYDESQRLRQTKHRCGWWLDRSAFLPILFTSEGQQLVILD